MVLEQIPLVKRVKERVQIGVDLVLSANDVRFYSNNWHALVKDSRNMINMWKTFIRARGLQKFQDEFRITRHQVPVAMRYIIVEAIRELGGFATARGFMATGRRKQHDLPDSLEKKREKAAAAFRRARDRI